MHKPYSPRPSEAHVDLIDALGGPKEVIGFINQHLNLPADESMCPQTCSMWKRRGIPFRYRAPLAIMASERGIDVPRGFLGEERVRR